MLKLNEIGKLKEILKGFEVCLANVSKLWTSCQGPNSIQPAKEVWSGMVEVCDGAP